MSASATQCGHKNNPKPSEA